MREDHGSASSFEGPLCTRLGSSFAGRRLALPYVVPIGDIDSESRRVVTRIGRRAWIFARIGESM